MTEVLDSTVEPWSVVPPEEFKERQEKVRTAAAAQGLDGVVVYSRGGAFMDMSQDVLYLTNHYSQQPYMGDESGVGSARSHGVVVVPVNGPSTVVVDIPWWRRELVVADSVRPSIDVTGTTVRAIRDSGLEAGKLGVVGSSYMTAAAWLGLAEGLPSATLVRADQLVETIRLIKSPNELKLIRRACELGNATLEALIDAVVEGATEAEAVAEASRILLRGGGVLYDAACASGPNAHMYTSARLPSADAWRRFEKGDMFHVDCYGSYGGYFFDFARSRVVGDDPTPDQLALLEATIGVVNDTCAQIRPGMTAGEIYDYADRWLKDNAFVASMPVEEPEMEGFPAVGHGLGLMWESPWLVEGDTTVIEPDMYLAVEMLLGFRGVGGAQFEHNGIVTEDGFEVLTNARSRWW